MFQKSPRKLTSSITFKTPEEIEKMRVAGRLAAEVLRMIQPHVREGVTTAHLDRLCHDYMVNVQQAIPAPLNYHGFPKSICTSVNHVVCHGIPGPKALKKGDVLNIDITVIKDGYHGDTSRMFHVGSAPIAAQRVSQVSYECMCIGLRMVRPGIRLGDIGHAIQKYAEAQHCSVVREYCGHGIGREFHEELAPGMVFTIEPMINAGKRHVKILPDGWTVVTKDHSFSAQWEHTVLVTGTGHEILTLPQGEML
jgi:methionyl aminopeptidase